MAENWESEAGMVAAAQGSRLVQADRLLKQFEAAHGRPAHSTKELEDWCASLSTSTKRRFRAEET